MPPNVVHIETTTRCVGMCSFCPHAEVVKERPEFMTDEMFQLVLRRVEEAGCFEAIMLFGNGDPFCDPKLPERVKMIPQQYRIVLYSSLGMPLTSAAVMAAARCNVILSATALSTAGRSARNENLKKVAVSAVHVVGQETAVARGIMLAGMTGMPIKVFPVYNWMGRVKCVLPVMDDTCWRVESQMYVLTDGTVALCCMDGAGEYALGNLTDDTVQDIYARPETQRYVAGAKGLPGCQQCNCFQDAAELKGLANVM